MPFQSKAQMKATFGGYLGSKMKSKAQSWAKETPNIKKLPEHKKRSYNSNVVNRAREMTNA